MKRRARRNHSAAFKAKIAIAAIKGERTIAEIAEQFDVHPNQVTTWKAQLEGGAAEVFDNGCARCRSAWQPNPGRRSTYRSGKSVRSTGATSHAAGQVRS
jgi:hypothetical protein